MNLYKIAGQVIDLQWESQYIHPNMQAFQCNVHTSIDLSYELQENMILKMPEGKPLIHSHYMSVYTAEDEFLIFYHNSGNVNACSFHGKSRHATIYITGSLNTDSSRELTILRSGAKLNLIDFIFYAMRDIFFLWIQKQGMLAVHSSSIVYQEKAYLFSACSGTGKTTQTDMWVNKYGVQILDGDVTVICLEDDIAIAYGLPWCGTSGKYQNRRVTLGGIIFLAQSCHNSVSSLTDFEAILRLSARCFTPTWTKEMANLNLTHAQTLVSKTLCCFLECLPNLEAVDMIKAYIDSKQ